MPAARTRLLTLTSLSAAGIAAVWMLFSIGKLGSERPLLTLFCIAAPVLLFVIPFAARQRRVSLDHLAHVFVGLLYGLITFIAASIGGAVSATSFFLVVVPILATLLLGVRPGQVWLGLIIATYAGLYLGRHILPAPHYDLSAGEIAFWNALTLGLLAPPRVWF